jgi:hypothetical protein
MKAARRAVCKRAPGAASPQLIAGTSAGTPAPCFNSGHGLLDARIALATCCRIKKTTLTPELLCQMDTFKIL